MHASPVPLLLVAAAVVAVLHSILPDHWVPLAVVARAQRWSVFRVARVSALASVGHVVSSLILSGIVAVIGLQFQHQLETQQGHIIGAVLVLTGLGFLAWGMRSGRQGHDHGHTHEVHEDARAHAHGEVPAPAHQQTLARRLAVIAVPFGVAASPDLTILPVALAASAVSKGIVAGVLIVFSAITIVVFVGLTVLATLAGYQIKGDWLERNANTITALVLIAIGIVAFVGF
jgi:nickel/cobalt transporter (NicO) family protein